MPVNYEEAFAPFLVEGPDESNEYLAYCPAHENPGTSEKPSATIKFENGRPSGGVWHCFSQGCSDKNSRISHLYDVYQKRIADGVKFTSNVKDFAAAKARRGGTAGTKPAPTEDVLKEYHEMLMESEEALGYWHERGVTDEILKKFNVGWRPQLEHFVLPVYDENGTCVNARIYDPFKKAPKFRWDRKDSENLLYGLNHWPNDKRDRVVIFEGEPDFLLARSLNLPAVTHTGGASFWSAAWNERFRNKHVYVAYDADKAGQEGEDKILLALARVAASVRFVKLPAGQDFTDYIKSGRTIANFRARMGRAENQSIVGGGEPAKAGRPSSVKDTENAILKGQPLEIVATVIGRAESSYSPPNKIHFECKLDKGDPCLVCPMADFKGDRTVELKDDDERLLSFIDKTAEQTTRFLLQEIAEAKCRDRIKAHEQGWVNVEIISVQDSIETFSADPKKKIHKAHVYNVGHHDTETNTTAKIVGKITRDHRDGKDLFQAWYNKATQLNIDNFSLTEAQKQKLKVFQDSETETPLTKAGKIAKDLAANVTKIHGREDLHIAYNLVWHSVLAFDFQGAREEKGWLEAIVMGDTRTGKSATAKKLTDHYRAGVVRSCEAATLAGLVGGAAQLGGNWEINWGLIPLNDRRLIVLDEASGLHDKNIIDEMSQIRTSGKAEVNKIVSGETYARTRLLWISNPPIGNGRKISGINGGAVSAIRDLAPNQEDIARFDFAMAVAEEEVPPEDMNLQKGEQPKVKQVYTSDLCSTLVMWAWSRSPEQIKIDANAEEAIIKAAIKLGQEYTSDIPLIQSANVRLKIARLAVAFATMTFSTTDGETVNVNRKHVFSAVEFLQRIYSNQYLGYEATSRAAVRREKNAYEHADKVKLYLLGKIKSREDEGTTVYKGLKAVTEGSNSGRFSMTELSNITRIRFDQVGMITEDLIDWGALVRSNDPRSSGISFDPSPHLIKILSELQDEKDNQPTPPIRPKRIKGVKSYN